MAFSVLIFHAYSADNLGDGLLVRETVKLVTEAVGPGAQFTVVATQPETFADLGATLVSSKAHDRRELVSYVRTLWRTHQYDLIVGVGGGYLRSGTTREAVKTAVVHYPQLWAASRNGNHAVYFPQSVGPAGWIATGFMRHALRKVRSVHLRDDRSMAEFPEIGATRTPDLAIMMAGIRRGQGEVVSRPVLSVRPIDGAIPAPVRLLARQMGLFDGFVQSQTAGNKDAQAMASLNPQETLSSGELFSSGTRRVVVAVRLHAALMSIAAGHFVVHLAYERKGFGAFDDLGLSAFVHPVKSFDPEAVMAQVKELSDTDGLREHYDQKVLAASASARVQRSVLVEDVRKAVGLV